MITVFEADKIISEHLKKYPAVDCALKNAYGKVLREEVRADRDYPPFNKSLMDGIAIKKDDYLLGKRNFHISGIVPAGMAPPALLKLGDCVEIMTGAVVPKPCDCVIPIEDITLDGKTAVVKNDLPLKDSQFIRRKGSDVKKHVIVVPSGRALNSIHLSTLASVGKISLKVTYQPKVAIVSTGDEIVPADVSNIAPFHIRQSNSLFIESALNNTHLFETSSFHLKDNKKILIKQISALLERFDILIFSGGVSMGKFDYLPEVFKELGIQVLFHKVRQKPGKPLLFGKSKKGQIIFALPGNPVSTQMATYRYVIHHLKPSLGLASAPESAILANDFKHESDFTYFMPVKLQVSERGQLEALSVNSGGSGDFAGVVDANAFMEIPEGMRDIKAGFLGKIFRWN